MPQIPDGIDFKEGAVLLFDKPLEWTSFQVVNKVRWLLCRKLEIKKLKVGHAGTLDPKATGLVVLCTGKKTKEIEKIQAGEKEYIATLKLGATTPSFDLESEEDEIFPTEHITSELIQETVDKFIGELDQVPPIFSAVKVQGKRAYTHARKGQEVELKSRKIIINEIEIVSFDCPELVIRVRCGKGTYIRSLARDLGKALGSGAYLTGLRRTEVLPYHVDNAWTIENFEKSLSELKLSDETSV